MGNKFNLEDLRKWHLIMKDFHQSGLQPKKFCNSRDIDYKCFNNKLYNFNYHNVLDAEEYEILLYHAQIFRKSGIKRQEFCLKYNIDFRKFKRFLTHINCRQLIAEMKLDQEDESLQFIKLPNENLTPINPVVEFNIAGTCDTSQNDIEITIAQGVKVIVSPTIDSTTIIKIIDLLKDL